MILIMTSVDQGDIEHFSNLVNEEILVLKSIYEDVLKVEEHNDVTILSMMLYPATADDAMVQYVCLFLELTVFKQHPNQPVKINFKSSRGLTDEQLRMISSALTSHASSNSGQSVLFDLIEMAKDALTSINVPGHPCPVCLTHFQDFDDFFKTECYHCFHMYCMYQYVVHWKAREDEDNQSASLAFNHVTRKRANQKRSDVPCPVCREPVSYDFEKLTRSREPITSQQAEVFDFSRVKREVREMEKLYHRQKENGGIIDIEAEKNKYLLSTIEQAYASNSTPLSSSSTPHLPPPVSSSTPNLPSPVSTRGAKTAADRGGQAAGSGPRFYRRGGRSRPPSHYSSARSNFSNSWFSSEPPSHDEAQSKSRPFGRHYHRSRRPFGPRRPTSSPATRSNYSKSKTARAESVEKQRNSNKTSVSSREVAS